MESQGDYEACADKLFALAEPIRLEIALLLFDGPKNVSEICGAIGQKIVKVSHHLKMLKQAKIVEGIREGRLIIYRLEPSVESLFNRQAGERYIDFGCCRMAFPTKIREGKRS